MSNLFALTSFGQCFYMLTVIASALSDFNPDVFCTLVANNTKIKDPIACNIFITCIDQKPYAGSCEGDLFYDRNLQKCVDPNTIKCYSSNPCAAKPKENGFVPDPYSCNSYYYCQNGKGTQGHCSPNMSFNPITKNCIRNYQCEQPILPEDYCNIVPDGVFIKVPDSCASYQVCWHGKLINGSCPDSYYFNAFLGKCDYITKGVCEDTTTIRPIEPANIKCKRPGIFVSDGISCNGYYYCEGQDDGSITLIYGECPRTRFFDAGDGGACVLRFNTICKFNRCVTLGYNRIQLANIYGDGCTGFHICEAGEVIGEAKCPSGQYFNELLQLCTKKEVTFPACKRPTSLALQL